MIKKYILLVNTLLCIVVLKLEAQNQGTYVKTFNFPGYTGAHSLYKTQDDGYVLTGEMRETSSGDANMYLYKASACGNVEWFRTFGSSTNDGANEVKQHSTNGYLITGYYDDNNGGGDKKDVSILKTDVFGNVIWHSTLNNSVANDEDEGNDLIELPGGNVIVGGYTSNFPWSGRNGFFSIISGGTGAMIATKVIGNNGNDVVEFVIGGSLNDFYIGGYTNSFGAGQNDIFLANVDASGNILWIKTYGTSANEGGPKEIKAIRVPTGILIVSYTDNTTLTAGGKDILLINVDLSGNVLWARVYGGNQDESGKNIIISSLGGYLVTGYTNTFTNGDRDAFVMRLDNSGNYLWSKSYGNIGCDYGNDIIDMGMGYIISNNYNNTLNTCSFNNEYDPLIIKIDSIGNSGCNNVSAFFSSNIITSSIISNNINVSSNSQDITSNIQTQYPVPYSTNPVINEQFNCYSCSNVSAAFSTSTNTLCTGDYIILQNTSGGSGGTCFQWIINNSQIINYKDTLILQPNPGSYVVQLNAICGNTVSSYNQTITVYPKPYSQFTFTNNTCFENLPTNYLNIGSSGIGYSYTWYLGSGATPSTVNTPNANNITYAYPGIKNVALVITNSYGCKDSVMHLVSIEPSPSVDFLVSKNPACISDTIYFINNSWIGSGSILNNFYWNFGDGNTSTQKNPFHKYSTAGTFTVTLVATSDYGCDDTAQYTIQIDNLSVSGNITPSFTTVCEGSNLGTLIVNGFNSEIQFWQMSVDSGKTWSVLSNTASIQGYYNLTNTTLFSAWVYNGTCPPVATPIATVQVDKKSDAGILLKDTVVCYGVNSGTLTLTNYFSTIQNWIMYDATNGYQIIPNTNSSYTFNNLTDTTQFAAVVQNGVCPSDTSNYVTVYVQQFNGAIAFPLDTSISLGYSVQITATGGSNYAWTPNYNISDTTAFNPIVWPYKDTTYFVIVTNQYGCVDTASVRIFVEKDYKLIIANTMTPNGDNYNDFFWIGMIEHYPNNEVMVFNRYGQMIYKANKYDNQKVYWDGTYQGNKVPDGAYYYVIKFTDSNVIFKGSINVISSH
ncbi:MAG: hypothetical protein KatS3mg027_1476 [Bacteroidia bacterium]|nr:MAG: hypothetical protein KatS3mg027_1476 [Bacteroidia bacterium]